MHWHLGLLALVGWLLALALPTRALACTVCTNPNVRPRAVEADPRRLRLELGAKLGTAEAGGVRVDDRRFDLLYTLAPVPGVELSVEVPTLARTVRSRGQASKLNVVPGDLELGVLGALWSWRATRVDATVLDERLFLRGSLKLPTAPIARDANESPLPGVLQPGCSSVVPTIGVGYAIAASVWSFSTGGSLVLPIPVRDAPHTGASLRSFATLSVRATRYLAGTLGLTTRLEPSGELRTDVRDPDSGGFVGSTMVGLSVAPVGALRIGIAMHVPIVQALAGDQRLSPTYAASLETQF